MGVRESVHHDHLDRDCDVRGPSTRPGRHPHVAAKGVVRSVTGPDSQKFLLLR